jgi:hypothetical protein
MGQQQLLLLVIGLVIVGMAVMAGFTAFNEASRKDEADSLVSHSLDIATSAFYWKSKNDPFAGGDQSYERLGTEGMEQLAMERDRLRGLFDITNTWADSIEITAVSARYPDIGVRVILDQNNIRRTSIAFDGSITMP